MVHSVTGSKMPSTPKKADSPPVDNGHRPGIISVIDTQTVTGDHVSRAQKMASDLLCSDACIMKTMKNFAIDY